MPLGPLALWAAAVVAGPAAGEAPPLPLVQRQALRYQVIAKGGQLNRRVLGEVTDDVRGVPAAPVDSLVYDGVGITPLPDAVAILEVDPVRQQGLLRVRWTDAHGSWEIVQSHFHHPEYFSGVRLGTSRTKVEDLINIAVAQNVYLHGDTGAGPPILPTMFTYLGVWGMASVTLDGAPFENKYGWPGPELWHCHAMLSEGIRGADGSVRALGGEVYDPARHKGLGATDPQDLELHVEFMDERFPETANRPSIFSFVYFLTFEDVVFKVTDSQAPLSFEDADALFGAVGPEHGKGH